jgi:hypothetical protein
MISAFPKIFAVGTKYVADIFDGPVEITEKLDGNQIGFGKVGGKLIVRSKGALINLDAPDSLFKAATDYIKSIESILPDNVFFYGECFKQPKHNTLVYLNIPKNHIALFGVNVLGEFQPHFVISHFADLLGFDVVPILIDGIASTADIPLLLERESYLGNAKVEGVVIKNYKKNVVLTTDVILPIMSAKYVSEAFKEVYGKRWEQEGTNKGKFYMLSSQYKTEARWAKAMQHLKEAGVLDNSPRDIGMLLKEIKEDIETEEKENIKDQLYNLYVKT